MSVSGGTEHSWVIGVFGAVFGACASAVLAIMGWAGRLQRDRGRLDEIIQRLEHIEHKVDSGFSDLHDRITQQALKVARLEGASNRESNHDR